MKSLTLAISLLFIFAIPLEDTVPIPVIGSIARAAGLLASATWLAAILITNRVRRPHPFHLVLCLYALWIGISVFWTLDTGYTAGRLETAAQLLIMAWMFWDLYVTRTHIDMALWAFLLGCYISCLIVLGSYMAGARADSGVSVARYSAFGFDPNDLGVMLAMAIPMLVRLTSERPGYSIPGWARALVFLYIPLCTLAILLTASRTAFVAMAVAYLFLFVSLTQVKVSTRLFTLFLLAAALYFVPRFVPIESLQRIAELQESIAAGDLTGRGEVWLQGIQAFVQQPLLGVGAGAFRLAVDSGKVAHNSFISVLTETGIIGFGLFFILLTLTVSAALQHRRPDAMLWLALLLMWMVGAFTLTWEFRKLTWILYTLIIASANVLEPVQPTLQIKRPRTVRGIGRMNRRSAVKGLV